MSNSSPPIVVVGAGIVGVCCALYLQRAGRAVTLVDPREPGDGCSFGNAGLLATGAVAPEALPGVARRVPKMLRDPEGPLSIRWSYLPRLAPFLLRYVLNSRPDRVEAISLGLAQLSAEVLPAFAPLLKSAGAEDLVERRGWLHVYESDASFAASQFARDLRRRRGVRIDDLGADEIRQLVPALSPLYKRGALFVDFGHTINPKRLTETLAADFTRAGGVVLRRPATGFEMDGNRVVGVRTPEGPIAASGVVVAAGAWSRELARMLGARLPLAPERGYHVMLPDPGVEVRLPVMLGEVGFGVTPMEHGLRIAGTVEFAAVDAPPNPARSAAMLRRVERALPGLQSAGRADWVGSRPSFPDAMPVIDRAPGIANAYFAFGHCHRGLSFSAITGKLIAELATGRPSSLDLAPYAADRFAGVSSLFRVSPTPRATAA